MTLKKIVAMLMSLYFLVFPNSVLAESRNAFEFCDLYTSRLIQLRDEYGVDVVPAPNQSYFSYDNYLSDIQNQFAGENQFFARTPAGTILVSVPDFSIVSFETTFINMLTDEDDSTELFHALMAISALEYNGFDDYEFDLLHKVDPSLAEDAIDATFRIFNEQFCPYLEDEKSIEDLMSSEKEILIYSGEYDYYLRYECLEGMSYEVINLTAVTK